ncbi:MAG: aminotransferase [Deltaproteobacteria bacterium]|nr:MAG: aminotransferase [Deltaproteobacteria bacterium]
MKNLSKKSIFLFETIKIVNQKPLNIHYHIQRAKSCVKTDLKFDFKNILNCQEKGLIRAKIIYDECGNLIDVQYFPYELKKFHTFTLVNADFDYHKKFLDRSRIDKAKNGFDEIILVKNSYITDTSIANIAIFDNGWITPGQPLLQGTCRQHLLDNNFLQLQAIKVEDLLKTRRFALMNAMTGFLELKEFRFELHL